MSSTTMPVGAGRTDTATVVHCLVEAAERHAERPAIVHPRATMTYAELASAVRGLAAVISGLRRGDGPVAVVMPNSPEMTAAAFAAWSLGAQVAFLNPNYTAHELGPLLADAEPSLVVTSAGHDAPRELAIGLDTPFLVLGDDDLDPLISGSPVDAAQLGLPEPGQLATMMFTGGTTGIPKGVDHTHRSLMMTVQGMEACWPTTMGTEVWLNVAPMVHIWGLLMGMLNPVYGAATVVMVPKFDPELVVSWFEAHGVTVFSGGPAEIYAGLLAAPNFASSDLSRLRVCPGGGSRFSPALLERWYAATGTRIHEAFGMTEIAPISCNPWGREPRPGSVGTAAPLVEISVVDLVDANHLPVGEVGEIAVRAPHLTVGYHRRGDSEQRTADGWFLTGDIGRLDEDGYLSILDRKKDMLLVGGFNVYPREIDETLLSHPHVLEAATIGVPDERKGQRPMSFVVLAKESATDRDDLLAYCAKNLVAYKRPLDLLMLPSLPRTPANKIDRKVLAGLWTAPGPVIS